LSQVSRDKVSAKDPLRLLLYNFISADEQRVFLSNFSKNWIVYLCCTYNNKFKIYKLHYNRFTPKIRFIYSIKRLFVYYSGKASISNLRCCINSPPEQVFISSEKILYLAQEVKKVLLALFCCVYSKKGGVLC